VIRWGMGWVISRVIMRGIRAVKSWVMGWVIT